jgi:hypothetical protein
VQFRDFRTLIDTGLMAPWSIGSIGAWVRLVLELNADLFTTYSISSSGRLSGPVWGHILSFDSRPKTTGYC